MWKLPSGTVHDVLESLPGYDLSRFHCTQCGNCCRMPGEVRLKGEDVSALAAFLDLSERDFIESHTRLTNDRKALSLKDTPDGSCCFLASDNTCRVNEAKPLQCRNFPFTWRYLNAVDVCPGVRACRIES
ncbi:MAG: YkgJ family cysteine cluster protein [Verrucomicrobia bacterium]|nr:YkgJ family cysteine cluster protein [Verrucomicrobiota bacterium]